ncbi:MAG: hypothetical protein HQL64_05925 [Magnetococcales bacterium]|nr:hypothetical protein [Magnetococcales bacterium]
MPWFASNLPDFPAIFFVSFQESRSDPTRITEFSGEHEQRISYAGPLRRHFEIKTALIKAADVDAFDAFWSGREGQNLPFKLTWRGILYYVRFDGLFTISWRPPKLASIGFAVKEMHPSEIIQ